MKPQTPVYRGMIVGEHCKDNDLDVNPTKAKAFSNMRESNKEATVVLKAARRMTLEMALEYIERDEAVEITPNHVRMRKVLLSGIERKRQSRQEKQREARAGA